MIHLNDSSRWKNEQPLKSGWIIWIDYINGPADINGPAEGKLQIEKQTAAKWLSPEFYIESEHFICSFTFFYFFL